MTPRHTAAAVAVLAAFTVGVSACGGSDASPTKVVLVTHDAFAVSGDVKAAFERESGLKLQILKSGDAGAALTTALLTAGNPQGDVFFGVDNNLLSRALDGDLFDAYESPALADVDEKYVLDPEHRVTPIDHGEACLNYDKAWFAEHHIAPPRSLDDLTRAPYDGLLVVEDPTTSTPGLAFMLATIARYGENGWQDYWRKLRERDVLVVDGWEEAYDVRFSGSSGKGSKPIVVSYASSPPAEVIFRTPRPKQAPTAVVEDSCFRQVELAGVLRGARNESGAKKLIDFLLSKRFQEDMPLTMFVFPVARNAALPPAFEKYAVVPSDPLDLPPDEIEANRERWLDEWTRVVIR